MLQWIKRRGTWLFVIFAVCFAAVNLALWGQLSLVRRFVTIFALLAAAHEVEEKVWPGGFFELMLRKFGIRKEEVDLERASAAVSVYWLLLLLLPYYLDRYAWLLVIPITLSFFEAFIHTAGVWIHHMPRPYTPGLVTAWLLAVAAVAASGALRAEGRVGAGGWMAGVLAMVVSFLGLDLFIVAGFGEKRKEIAAKIRAHIKDKQTRG